MAVDLAMVCDLDVLSILAPPAKIYLPANYGVLPSVLRDGAKLNHVGGPYCCKLHLLAACAHGYCLRP